MTQTTFLITSLLSLLLFYFGIGRDKRLVFIFFIWQLIIGILSFKNVFDNNPNLFPLAIAGTVLLTFISLKVIDKQKLNTTILLSIHILRIPVELILLQLFFQNKIPLLMTFKGWNFDILIGLSALLILIFQLTSKHKINQRFFIIWNIIGIAFLLFIVTLAILSSPLPIQKLAFEQPNIAVLEFPYCFLPTCIVPIVLMSHILLTTEPKKHYR